MKIAPLQTSHYRCEITPTGVSILEAYFGIAVPPGEMLALAHFILSHQNILEGYQQALDRQHETLVQEIKKYCRIHGKSFTTLSSWDITDVMRELAGTTGHCDEWESVENLSQTGRWYRTVCCDESGGIYSHIWEPFYTVCQQWQQREEETEVTQELSLPFVQPTV